VNTGAITRSVTALEGPLAQVNGNQTQRVTGRSMSIDAAGTTAYALTTSGLSIIPADAVLPAERPIVNPNGVVNMVSYLPTFAPGSLGTIFGRNMATDTGGPVNTALPTVAGGVCVTLNNQPLPLVLTSDRQINFQVPPTLAAGRYPLVVRSLTRLAASTAFQVTVTKVAPAVFTDDKGLAALYHANGKLVTKDNPAQRDEPLSLYATGLGVTKGGAVVAGQPAPSSPLAVTDKVQVYFGNPCFQTVRDDYFGRIEGKGIGI